MVWIVRQMMKRMMLCAFAAGLLGSCMTACGGENDRESSGSSAGKTASSSAELSEASAVPESESEPDAEMSGTEPEEQTSAVELEIVDNGCPEWTGDAASDSVTIEGVTYTLMHGNPDQYDASSGTVDFPENYYCISRVLSDSVPTAEINGKSIASPKLYGKINGIPVMTTDSQWLYDFRRQPIHIDLPNTVCCLLPCSMGHLITGEITIPSSVKYIGASAFSSGLGVPASVSKINLSDGLEFIGKGAFCGNGNGYNGGVPIQEITIPVTVKLIQQDAFWSCTELTSVKIEGAPLYLAGTFSNCIKLKTVEIAEGVQQMGSTFQNCESLEEVVIPASVKEIGRCRVSEDHSVGGNLFGGCISLKSVTILNPECVFDSDSFTGDILLGSTNHDNVVLKGYKGSTTEQYAQEKGYKFEAID